MELSDLQTWKDGAAVLIGAPHIVFPLLIAIAGASWWLRGQMARSEKDALVANIQVLKEKIDLKDEQIALTEQQIKLKDEQSSFFEKRIQDFEEQWKTNSLSAPVKASPEPKLFMSSANVSRAGEPFKDHTTIFLYASVVNTGSPTRAVDWTLSIIPKGEMPVVLRPRAIANEVTLSGAPGSGQGAVIKGADSLIAKIGNTPLGLEPVEGWLFFLTEMPQSTVVHKKTRFELSMRDVYGNEAKVSRLVEEF